MVWDRDIPIEWTGLETTGGTLWEAAHRMADFLEKTNWNGNDKKVLELGSGVGWLGMVIGKNFSKCKVTMTEQENGGALDWTRQNLQRHPEIHNVIAEPLDWLEPNEELLSQHWDLVIGSDLVYNEAGVNMLPPLLGKLLLGKSNVEFLYAHTRYRYEDSDMSFLRHLRETGLRVREVWPHGVRSPPPSPKAMTQIFQDKRIAIWNIQDTESYHINASCRVADHSPTDEVTFQFDSD